MSILDSPSQTSTLSSLSPSSATLSMSSSPPGSAAMLCSPHSSVFQQQGMLIDVLSSKAHILQAGGSQDDKDQEDSRPRMCLWDGCSQEFPTLSSLVAHLDRGHTLSMTKYTCHWKDCPRNLKPFDARYKLITHLRCHTGEKPFKCDVASCNRCFSRLENLKLHVRTHTGEKPYECHYEGCTKKFNNTSDRAKHMKTHVMRKPYACKHPGCEKSYTDPSSMRKHIKYSHRPKDRPDSGTSSGINTDNSTSQRSSIETNSFARLESSEVSRSISAAGNPLTSPTFVFPSPTSRLANFSPPAHSPHASLPQESATTSIPSSKRSKKLSNGTPLVATGPVVSSQPHSTQLIPLPLLQLPSGGTIPQQQLGLLPPGIQNNMILMPAATIPDATMAGMQLNHPQQQVLMVIPPSLNTPPIREMAVATSTPSHLETTSTSGETVDTQLDSVTLNEAKAQQNVETQLRQTIAQLQQQLSNTQNLLAHQNASFQQHMATPMLRQNPPLQVVLQQFPAVNTPSSDSAEHSSTSAVQNSNTIPVTASTHICTSVNADGQISTPEYICIPNSSSQHLNVGETVSSSAPGLSSMFRSGGTPFVPVLQPQCLQFLYMPPTPPHTSV